MFPPEEEGKGDPLQAFFHLPCSDTLHRDPVDLERMMGECEPLESGHTLTRQIGGQLSEGFILTDMYEDSFGETAREKLTDTFIATRARKEF